MNRFAQDTIIVYAIVVTALLVVGYNKYNALRISNRNLYTDLQTSENKSKDASSRISELLQQIQQKDAELAKKPSTVYVPQQNNRTFTTCNSMVYGSGFYCSSY